MGSSLFLQGVLGTGNLTLAGPNGSSRNVTTLVATRAVHGERRAPWTNRRTRNDEDGMRTMNVAVVFPGQGSQSAGMADVWMAHPAGRSIIEEVSEAMGRDLAELSRDEEALKTTEVVQPALFACDLAAFRVLEADGVRFSAAAGHSLGEFVALVAAGVLDDVDAFGIVVVRGRAMQEASDAAPSGMTAIIGLSPADAA